MSIDHVSKALELILKLNDICTKLSDECAKAIKRENETEEKAKERFSGECGEGIARRAEDAPQLVYSLGLVPSLTLFMSKVEDWLITTLLTKYLMDKSIDVSKLVEWIDRYAQAEARYRAKQYSGENRSEEKERIEKEHIYRATMRRLCTEFSASTSAGYSAMLSVVLAYLYSMNKLDKNVLDSVEHVVTKIENTERLDKQEQLSLATNLAQYLLNLHEKEEPMVIQITIPFLLEFKKLAKAILEKEK